MWRAGMISTFYVLGVFCAAWKLAADMKDITLKLDDSVLTRMRHVAVDEHKSVSAWVRALVVHELNALDLYEQDRQGALIVLKDGLPLGGSPLTREEVHER